MHKSLEALIQKAEDHYLQEAEISVFSQEVESLKVRLELYQWLQEREITIFQPIATELGQENTYPQKTLEKALKHWIGVLRYGAMAMLLNNPEFLQHRLLEWLAPTMNARQRQAVELAIYEALKDSLTQLLDDEQLSLIMPFVNQAAACLSLNSQEEKVKEITKVSIVEEAA
ncbi:MAG: phycobilisome protein [Microcystaceae cyanobacterium]